MSFKFYFQTFLSFITNLKNINLRAKSEYEIKIILKNLKNKNSGVFENNFKFYFFL